MTELQSAQLAARRKAQLRGPVFSYGQTAPYFGYGLCLYYGGYLISTEGLPYKNVVKLVHFLTTTVNSKVKFLMLTNAIFYSVFKAYSH
jgi:hypothetical protein